jgi:biotin transporter BioY
VVSGPIGLQSALATGLYPFVLPDLIKLAIAAGLVPALWRIVGRTDAR